MSRSKIMGDTKKYLKIMLVFCYILSLTTRVQPSVPTESLKGKSVQQDKNKLVDLKAVEYSSIGKIIYQTNFAYKKSFCERHNCDLFPVCWNEYNPSEGLLVSKCGPRHIVLTKRKTTGVHLWWTCCSLGMAPGSLTSPAELKCLLEELAKSKDVVTWQSNTTFLVNYFDQELRREFSTCPDKRALPAQLWATAQPDNAASAQACVALSLQTSKQIAGLDDVNCMDKYYALCQYIPPVKKGIPKYSDIVKGIVKNQRFVNEQCEVSTCYFYPAKPYFYENVQTIPPNEGLLITNCGKIDYYLSKTKAGATNCWKFCCSRGMQAIKIESRETLNCIYDAYKNSTGIFLPSESKFWTAQYDHKLDRRFLSCPDYIEVPEDLWIPGEPDNVAGMQTTVAINLGVNRANVGLEDLSVLENLPVACQEENELRYSASEGATQNKAPATQSKPLKSCDVEE